MTSRHASLIDDQTHLSEQLQLLNQLAPQQHQRDCHLLTTEDSYTNDALQLLDVITVALTTGNPGEVFAAAFDGCQGLTLVLAKNSVVTIEDDRAVHNLFTAITASTTKDADDVLPFLLSRCQANMEKRIQKMGESVAALLHDLEEVLQGYKPSRFIHEEFPRSGQYRKGMHASSFLQMIQHLLKQLTMMIQDINSGSNNLSAQLYKDLAAPARILLKSRLLHFIKFCQYYHGINNLIRQAKRYCPHDLDYRWVDVSTGTGARTIELDSNYWQAVSRAFGEPLTKGNIAALHPEIRIILHLSDNFRALQHCFPQQLDIRHAMAHQQLLRKAMRHLGAPWLFISTCSRERWEERRRRNYPGLHWVVPGSDSGLAVSKREESL